MRVLCLSEILIVSILALTSTSSYDVYAISESCPSPPPPPPSQIHKNNNDDLFLELQQLKLKAAHLESVLEERVKDVTAKSNHIEEHEKLLEEMTSEIHRMNSIVLSTKVRDLWDASRKNNFDLHVLESKVEDAENRLEDATSQVEKLADVVTEQWIQIQRLEQALLMAERRKLDVHEQLKLGCTFLKFIDALSSHHLPKAFKKFNSYVFGKESTLNNHMSYILKGGSNLFTAAKTHHHQFQRYIKQEMEKSELMAPLANEEVVFFMVSALIIFPILSFWMLISS